MAAVIFDLDDTLVATSALRELRQQRRWKEAVQSLHRTSVFPGVEEAVRGLAAKGVPWAVVTTSVSYYAERVLAFHGLNGVPLVAYHDARPKPHPEPVLVAMEKLGHGADAVVGVGDSDSDRQAYHAAGVRAIGAGWSPELEATSWDAVLMSPREVLGLL